jgi:hypothetical protein
VVVVVVVGGVYESGKEEGVEVVVTKFCQILWESDGGGLICCMCDK